MISPVHGGPLNYLHFSEETGKLHRVQVSFSGATEQGSNLGHLKTDLETC